MLTSAVFGLTLAAMLAQEQVDPRQFPLPIPEVSGVEERLLLMQLRPLDNVKVSPVHEWGFSFGAAGYGPDPRNPEQASIRFRLFAQQVDEEPELGNSILRMLLRLWDYNVRRLRLDHRDGFFLRSVDVYLAEEGTAGAERIETFDPESTDQFGRPSRVNVIYIYDRPTFQDPLQRVREIAHEYGHATLPPIGVLDDPEDWGEGHLGEHLYMKWLAEDLRAGNLEPADVMGVTAESLTRYVEENTLPLLRSAIANGPNRELMSGKNEAALNRYVGLVLMMEETIPRDLLTRAMMLRGDQSVESLIRAAVEATEGYDAWLVQRPRSVQADTFWIPLGGGVIEGAQILERREGWARVQLTGDMATVTAPE